MLLRGGALYLAVKNVVRDRENIAFQYIPRKGIVYVVYKLFAALAVGKHLLRGGAPAFFRKVITLGILAEAAFKEGVEQGIYVLIMIIKRVRAYVAPLD